MVANGAIFHSWLLFSIPKRAGASSLSVLAPVIRGC